MSGSFRVELRNKYGRLIKGAHTYASPLFNMSICYFQYGTDGRKQRGTRARVAEKSVPFDSWGARH